MADTHDQAQVLGILKDFVKHNYVRMVNFFPWLKKKTMGNRSYVPQPASNQIVLLQVGQGKVSSFENDTPFNVFDGNPRCTSL